jgi:itaconate CoA-transferase
VFGCRDGARLLLAVEHDAEWRLFATAVLERPDLAEDPRFATNVARLANRDEVDALVAAAFADLEGVDMLRRLDELGFAYASLNDMEAVGAHPVVAQRGMLEQVETSDGALATTLVGIAERLFDLPPRSRARPPQVGEDTIELVGQTPA